MEIRIKSREEELKWRVPNLKLLTKGRWLSSQIIVNPLMKNKTEVLVHQSLQKEISKNWEEIKKKNPKAFAGPTVRLSNYHLTNDTLVLDILPSDYSQGQYLGWLGVAMVPITSDGIAATQAPVAGIAASIGGGIRVPGCTPPHADFIPHILKEMREEFNIDIDEDQLTILGVMEVLPPTAKRHNAIIVKVNLEEDFTELKNKWQTAEDKWEGDLLPYKLANIKFDLFNENYAIASRLILSLIAEDEYEYSHIEIIN